MRVVDYLARKRQRYRQNVIDTSRLTALLRETVIKEPYQPSTRRKTESSDAG